MALVAAALVLLPFHAQPAAVQCACMLPCLLLDPLRIVLCSCCTGMALATLFVTLPFVVRELLPILEQMDMAEEEAAR
jgi:ABC-type sulfate transport system permease subunit